MQTTRHEPAVIHPDGGLKMKVVGQDVRLLVTSHESRGDYYMFEVTSAPGTGIPPHMHEQEDEVLQVLDGEFEIFLDGKKYKVAKGDVLNLPRLVPHGFLNIGTKPGRTLFTVIPGANFERFFEELGMLPPEGQPDMVKVSEIFRRHHIDIL